jgi:orotate phosphoribosyltransferase
MSRWIRSHRLGDGRGRPAQTTKCPGCDSDGTTGTAQVGTVHPMPAPVSVTAAIRELAVSRRDEPFALASGQTSFFYVDVKRALCHPEVLRDVSRAIAELATAEGIGFTHVGGLTMGADAVAVGVSFVSGARWFSVRKEPKQRGHSRLIEGADLDTDSRVLLVDDVVSTGGSTVKALNAVIATGAVVVAAIPVVDRGAGARAELEARGVRYLPLVSHDELGIPALGAEDLTPKATQGEGETKRGIVDRTEQT